MAERRPRRSADDMIDEASMESFPASDPPGYRTMSVGGPAMVETERRPSTRRADLRRTVAAAQGAYFIATGTAVIACAGLAAVDVARSIKGRISRVYLVDAALELAFVGAWILSARGERDRLAQ